MSMNWVDLAFLHWPVPAASLAPATPRGLELDTCQGSAWLSVVPFTMDRVRARGLPPIPGTATFLELNLRTYVSDGQRPGVWFFSLDADHRLAVRAGRVLALLPYMDARMTCRPRNGWLDYTSDRIQRGAPEARFAGRYRPDGAPFQAAPGTLEHFLTERYCFYSADPRGRVYRCDVEHPPWTLQPCRAEVRMATLGAPLGLALPGPVPLAHFSARQEVRCGWRRPSQPTR